MGEYTDYLLRLIPAVTTTREKDEAIALACNNISELICTHALSTDSIRQLKATEVPQFLSRIVITLDKVQDNVDCIRGSLPEDLR